MAWSKIKKSAHGFVVKNVVRFTGTDWEKAKADTLSYVRGVVSEVTNVDRFTVTYDGIVRIPNHGLVVGDVHYISPTTSGATVVGAPSTGIVEPIFTVVDDKTLFVFAPTAGKTSCSTSFVDGDLSGANELVFQHNLGRDPITVQVFDSSNVLRSVTTVYVVDENSVRLDFTGMRPLAGTWKAIVVG